MQIVSHFLQVSPLRIYKAIAPMFSSSILSPF